MRDKLRTLMQSEWAKWVLAAGFAIKLILLLVAVMGTH